MKPEQQGQFENFRKDYAAMLKQFLQQTDNQELLLNEGYKFGRKAISQNISLLSITSIHHDILAEYLENLATDEHLQIAVNASQFFEEIIAPYQMVTREFREAIKLLENHTSQFATHIHNLKKEIMQREQMESKLQENLLKYQQLSDRLKRSLKEKEFLLKEVYHRVKNNLQVITSLINLQMDTVMQENTILSLQTCSARIRTMALIHEMLYQSNSLSEIEIGPYMQSLINYLFEIYNTDAGRIICEPDIDPVCMSVDSAIPLGLLVNEIVSNSLKHAFRDQRHGIIYLTIKREKAGIIMQAGDNGCGIPVEKQEDMSKSLGMRLIHNLARQLDGEITLNTAGGSMYTLRTSRIEAAADTTNF